MSARPMLDTVPTPTPDGRALLALIRHMGRTLDDLENLRVRHENRRGAFERDYEIVLPPDDVTTSLNLAEHQAELELKRLWRKYPLSAWAKGERGVGEISIARLFAEMGDPADRPNVAKLWAYCGVGNPALIRVPKNATQEDVMRRGNRRARSQLFVIASAIVKQRCAHCTMAERARRAPDRPNAPAPWAPPPADCVCAAKGCIGRVRYDARRVVTRDGRDWTPGHEQSDALRIVAKDFLRDLWVAARTLQARSDTQRRVEGAGS